MTDVKTWAERIHNLAQSILADCEPNREASFRLDNIRKYANEIIEISQPGSDTSLTKPREWLLQFNSIGTFMGAIGWEGYPEECSVCDCTWTVAVIGAPTQCPECGHPSKDAAEAAQNCEERAGGKDGLG